MVLLMVRPVNVPSTVLEIAGWLFFVSVFSPQVSLACFTWNVLVLPANVWLPTVSTNVAAVALTGTTKRRNVTYGALPPAAKQHALP